jgi:hypothetical protein
VLLIARVNSFGRETQIKIPSRLEAKRRETGQNDFHGGTWMGSTLQYDELPLSQAWTDGIDGAKNV